MPSNYELAQQNGVQLDREDFFNVVTYNWVDEFYESMTVETFLCHVELSIPFCDKIRKKLGVPELENFVILNTLLSCRKAGRIGKAANVLHKTRSSSPCE